MKAELDPVVHFLRGGAGNFVYRKIRGKTIVSPKPVRDYTVLSDAQAEHRVRFKKAAAYGKLALMDSDVRPLYEESAKERNVPLFAVMMADFFNAPVIETVNTDPYTGQANQVIQVIATDDFGVVKVHVKISDLSGNLIESGDAVNTSNGIGPWTYTTQYSMDRPVDIEVVATDRPGGTAVTTIRRDF